MEQLEADPLQPSADAPPPAGGDQGAGLVKDPASVVSVDAAGDPGQGAVGNASAIPAGDPSNESEDTVKQDKSLERASEPTTIETPTEQAKEACPGAEKESENKKAPQAHGEEEQENKEEDKGGEKEWADIDVIPVKPVMPAAGGRRRGGIQNYKFYCNQIVSVPSGNYIDHIHVHWFYDYERLESHHGYNPSV